MIRRAPWGYRIGLVLTERNVVLAIPIVLAVLGVVFAQTAAPRWGPVITALYLVAAVANAASAGILLYAVSVEERVPGRILAGVFAFNAAVTLTLALVTSFSPAVAPVIDLGRPAPTMIYSAWHVLLGGFAIAFSLFFRRQPDGSARMAARARLWAVTTMIAVVAVAGAGAVIWRGAVLAPTGLDTSAAFQQLVGPLELALCLCGTVMLIRLPRSVINRAFTLSMLALTLDVALVLIAPNRYSVSRYLARFLIVLASSSVFVLLVRGLLFDRIRLLEVQEKLGTTEAESRMRASQFRALWQAATVDRLGDGEFFQTINNLGSGSLRPGYPLYGYVSELDGDAVVVEAISFCGEPCDGVNGNVAPEFAFTGHVERFLLEAGTTRIWRAPEGRQDVWASAIGTPITMGAKTHFLIFASTIPLDDKPFAESDIGFVEVLGSQISHRYYQQDQYARLRYQLEHDSLTGLLNTTEARKELRLAIAKRLPVGIARLNLDRFGEINTSHGHMIGDEILVEVGAMLQSVDPDDTVARMSGDDFIVIMPGAASETELEQRLARYRAVFDQPFHTGDRDGTRYLPVTCSFGAALFPRDGSGYEELMGCAEVSLASAKKSGGASAVIFSDVLRAAEQERGLQRREILEGLMNDAFFLEYQPTFDLTTGGIVGAEALIRWDHPVRGRLMPADFLPFAEQNAVMGRLTGWVLARVFRDLRPLRLPDGFRCYVNVPAHIIDNEVFLSHLERELAAAPHLQQHLGVEITESDAMRNVEKTIVALQLIRRRGLRVAIDDFGTGYSSLAYLKRLPVDMVKLDRAFVSGLPGDPKDVSVTELFLGLTDRMGVTSLAEGIETEAQAAWLREHGCQIGQGYLVSPPVPLDRLPAFLERATVLSPANKRRGKKRVDVA